MNASFVRRHVKCGKSRMRPNIRYPDAVWFGAPNSSKFLRCYPKREVGGFRMELQVNRKLLEVHGIKTANDFLRLVAIVVHQVQFFRVDWKQLTRYVRRNLRHPEAILRKAHERKGNLNKLLRFLRQVRVANPDRFLVSLPVNQKISAAVRRWAKRWEKDGSQQTVRTAANGKEQCQ